MANETTTTSLNDLTYATLLEEDVQRELRPHRIFRNFLRQGPKGPSKAYTFNKIDDSGSTVTDITEGTTDLITTLTSVASTGMLATAAQHGIVALVTDLVKTVSILDVGPLVTDVLARHMAEAYDAAAQGEIDSYANSTGGATTNTLARLLTAVSALEQRDVGSRGETLVAGQHPKQVGDLRADAASLTATFMAGNDANVSGILAASLDGYVGDPFGIPVFMSSTITSASSNYLGWVMANKAAVGAYELWLERVEIQRDASLVSDEVVCTSAYGFKLIDDNRIQGWKSTT